LDKSRQWAMRCMHEASLHDENSFITLTYEEEHLPDGSIQYNDDKNPTYCLYPTPPANTLIKKHFQDFMKRLRKKNKNKIRYYHCGEYGDLNARPHYHAILFNKDFPDKIPLNNKKDLFTSEELHTTWNKGFVTTAIVNFDTCAYVSRYIMKKQNGEKAITHYVNKEGEQILPEYSTMSRRPGIANTWFEQNKDDIYHKDFITMKGFKMKPPKYYDDLMYEIQPAYMSAIKKIRMENFDHTENTPERLAVKKACAQAKMSHFKRSL